MKWYFTGPTVQWAGGWAGCRLSETLVARTILAESAVYDSVTNLFRLIDV